MAGYIVRYSRSDQHPRGADLRQAARDSVIRYARHHGLTFRWLHDQGGQWWAGPTEPIPVYGWRSEALIVEDTNAPA